MRSVTSGRAPVLAEAVTDLDLARVSHWRRGARAALEHPTPRWSGFRPRTVRVHLPTMRRELMPKGYGSPSKTVLDGAAGPDAS